ncbi:hypothetical protein R4E93_07825 [Bacteroides ovatus]|jgi:hypothetical protein|uniref:hypothetical protein n=1 Tax=Bacteroides ovatus TaxID=28116 RepID=UPI0029539024|nr:hypothetical protein [Bacteroides ovatus]MDV7051559.1 hypothetical protein [Bacteroides ovatus]
MKQTSKVYHVELSEPIEVDGKSEKHFYFGSQAAIYGTFSAEQLGISYGYLKSKFHLEEKPYSNDKCTIRLGALIRKEKSE